MDQREIERVLVESGHGILALARNGEAYGVPVSIGYDGDRVLMYLIRFGDASKKLEFSQQTTRACLTTYRVESRFDWHSVIVTGTLHEVSDDEADRFDAVLDDNAWFPSIFPPTAPITAYRRTELRIEEATGRKGERYSKSG